MFVDALHLEQQWIGAAVCVSSRAAAGHQRLLLNQSGITPDPRTCNHKRHAWCNKTEPKTALDKPNQVTCSRIGLLSRRAKEPHCKKQTRNRLTLKIHKTLTGHLGLVSRVNILDFSYVKRNNLRVTSEPYWSLF